MHEVQDLQRYNRGLIETSLDPLVTFDQKGIILDVNEATIRATGRTREELIGTPLADYFTGNRRKLKIIQDEARRLELMLTDVSDFTRPSRPQKELQDINSIIENTLALLENDFKDKGISCEKSLDSDIPLIFFDPRQIEQLLINLAKNALEAMPSGGKFFISSWREDKQVKVSAVLRSQPLTVVLESHLKSLKRYSIHSLRPKKRGPGWGLQFVAKS